jgi:hypothetical protein
MVKLTESNHISELNLKVGGNNTILIYNYSNMLVYSTCGYSFEMHVHVIFVVAVGNPWLLLT